MVNINTMKTKEYDDCKKNYLHKFSGWLSQTYSSMKYTSKRRKHHKPNFTKEELKSWLINNYPNELEELFQAWKDSGYVIENRPSIDRLEDCLGYHFDNIRLTTWRINNKKGHLTNTIIKNKSINKLDLNGNIVQNYKSIADAGREVGNCSGGNISKVLSGKINSAYGYKWGYA